MTEFKNMRFCSATAMEHGPLYSVTRTYGELAGLMSEIADELLGEDPLTRGEPK